MNVSGLSSVLQVTSSKTLLNFESYVSSTKVETNELYVELGVKGRITWARVDPRNGDPVRVVPSESPHTSESLLPGPTVAYAFQDSLLQAEESVSCFGEKVSPTLGQCGSREGTPWPGEWGGGW